MSTGKRGLVRGIAFDAWRDVRRRPVMWLIISASCMPLNFFYLVLIPQAAVIPGFSPALYMLILLVGYSICFTILFFFWCMAVFYYDGQVSGGGGLSYGGAYRLASQRAFPLIRAGLACGLIGVLASLFAQPVVAMVISLIASAIAAGESGGAVVQFLVYASFYLGYVVADLLLVFIVMAPQMLTLEGGTKLDEVLRAGYMVVKERYGEALLLLIVPEVIVRTLVLGVSLVAELLGGGWAAFLLFLLALAALEGLRTAFLAAAYNRFYYHVLEEEREKKRAKGKQQGGKPQGKKPTAGR